MVPGKLLVNLTVLAVLQSVSDRYANKQTATINRIYVAMKFANLFHESKKIKE